MYKSKNEYKIILSERLFNKNFLGIGDATSRVKGFIKGLIPSDRPRMVISGSNNPIYREARTMVKARNKLINMARFDADKGRGEFVMNPSAKDVESAARHIDRIAGGGIDDIIAQHNATSPDKIEGSYRDHFITDLKDSSRRSLNSISTNLIRKIGDKLKRRY